MTLIKRQLELIRGLPRPQQALSRLAELTSKPVSLERLAPLDLAVLHPCGDEHVIKLDPFSTLAEHGLMHELIHAILFEEGYPCVDTGCRHSADLTNGLQHPEVFRRMREEYGLDMAPYFSTHWRDDIQRSLDWMHSLPTKDRDNLITYNIVNQFVWHYIDGSGQDGLKEFAVLAPDAYELTIELHREAQAIGFESAEKAHRFAKLFTTRVHTYARDHGLGPKLITCWENPRIVTLDRLLATSADAFRQAHGDLEDLFV